ncbi:endonuclease [Lentzea sp. NPDC006480]|uniref:endonuclease n=1 Tax=Lentzea sp. NPDC006480 TaxID=3157176 RepID=UPI0033A69CAE
MARWSPLALVIGLLAAVGLYGSTAAVAAVPLTVAQAIATQNGSANTVRGYVVGQPTATNTVVRSNYPSDYALALADSASQTSTSNMVYVQIPSAFRASWGMQSNPSLLGKQIDVTGTLSAYFSHAGLISTTAFAFAGTAPPTTTTTPPPTTTTTPPTSCEAYYTAACGKSGAALKSALNGIIKNHTVIGYGAVWDALMDTDQDPNNSNNVILVYSGISRSKAQHGATSADWNREHVWAKSHGPFDENDTPGNDIHHLKPEDVDVNAARGSLDFDNGGSPVTEAPQSRKDGDSFEPRDAVKGDVARMLFYMAVRYESGPDLELNNSVGNGSAPLMGKLSVLKQWSQQDPPDAFEKRRNQVIFDRYQHNRNPFIDHPEWVSAIWP